MRKHLEKVILLTFLLSSFLLRGQDESYIIHVEAVALPVLIDLLEKNYNVRFSYQSNLLENETFYLKTNTPDLSDILNEISAIYPIEYQILNNKSILLREQYSKKEEEHVELNNVTFSIYDSETNEPIESAALGILGTNKGDYSDQKGKLMLSLPNGKTNVDLEIHLLGYKDTKITWNGTLDQKIKLEAQNFTIEEVMVQDRMNALKSNSLDHSVTLNTSHISALTSGIAGQDIVRQAQLLPGVAAYDDISSGLKIRGADEASSLIVLDDIPIYNASHYYGLFSSINPTYTTSSTLYKNNLPVEYDGKTAGMLEIKGPSDNPTNQTNGSLDINLLTISGTLNTSISNNLSLSIGARTTYQNISDTDLFSLFNNSEKENPTVENFSLSSRDVLLSTIPDFKFYDVISKLKYNWKKGSLELNYLQSEDDLDDSFSNEFRTRRERVVITNRESYQNTEKWMNRGMNLKMEMNLSKDLDLSTIAYMSSYKNESGLNIGLSRSIVREFQSLSYENLRENNVMDYGFKAMINSRTKYVDWSAGIDLVHHDVNVLVTEQDVSLLSIESSSLEKSLFASMKLNFGAKTKLEFGLRGTSYNSNFYSSPRFNLSHEATDKFSLKASVGRHNQFVRQLSFESSFGRSLDFWVLSENDRFEVSSADQLMVGATYKYGRLTFDLESYIRKRYDLLEQALFDPRFDESSIFPLSSREGNTYRLFSGDGKTLGFDLTVGMTYPKYSGWLTYTLSKSTIQYDQILRGTVFPSQDDRRHQITWVNEYHLGRFTFGANVLYASGKPYTDLNKVASALRRDQLTPEARLSRLPDYIRADLGISYKTVLAGTDAEIGLSAYNLLNRQNVNYVQYLFSIPTNSANNPNSMIRTLLGTESSLLDRTVNMSLKVNF